MQTRGKPTLALRHAGGAVREIDKDRIADLARQADLPAAPDVIDRLYCELRNRLIAVDAPPVTLRDDPKAVEGLEKAAGDMLEAIGKARDWGDIKLSLQDAFAEKGWPYDDQFLIRALLVLKDARAHLFEHHKPTDGYHCLIRSLHGAIRDAGGNVAVHERSRFMAFLMSLESEFAGLIFPSGTVATMRGRCRYVERALSSGSDSPN